MNKLAQQLMNKPTEPTSPIDPKFAGEIVPRLRAIFSDVTCQGREDRRGFTKNYDIVMVPFVLPQEDDSTSTVAGSSESESVKISTNNTPEPTTLEPELPTTERSDESAESRSLSTKERAMQMVADIENDSEDDLEKSNTLITDDSQDIDVPNLIENQQGPSGPTSTPQQAFPSTQTGPEGPEEDQKPKIGWDYPSDIPEPVLDVIRHYRDELKIPIDAPCKIYLGLHMRKNRMIAPKPEKMVISRVVLNFNHKDVYSLIEPNSDRLVVVRDVFLDENTALMLGPADVSGFKIMVQGNPKVKVSNGPPSGVPGMRNMSKERFIIRPIKYEGLRMILDFGTSSEMARQLTGGATDQLSNPTPFLQQMTAQVGSEVISTIGKQAQEAGKTPMQANNLQNAVKGAGKAMRKANRRKNRQAKKKQAKQAKHQQQTTTNEVEPVTEDISRAHDEEVLRVEDSELDDIMNAVRGSKSSDIKGDTGEE